MHASYEARLKSPTKRLKLHDTSPSKRLRGHSRAEDAGERWGPHYRSAGVAKGTADRCRFIPMRDSGLPLPFESMQELDEEEGEEAVMDVPSRGRDLYAKVSC